MPKEKQKTEMFLSCHLTARGVTLSFMYLDLGKTRSLSLTKRKNSGLGSMKQKSWGFIKDIFRASKMAQRVKVLASKLGELSWIPGTHAVE